MNKYDRIDHPVRTAVYDKMKDWPIETSGKRGHLLATALGFATVADMLQQMTDDHAELCKLMAGPNGYTVYKMLLARKEEVS